MNDPLEDFEKPTIQEQKEVLKLFKNTKGYNWEIRLIDIDINRIEELNNEMVKRFGSE